MRKRHKGPLALDTHEVAAGILSPVCSQLPWKLNTAVAVWLFPNVDEQRCCRTLDLREKLKQSGAEPAHVVQIKHEIPG